MEGKAIVAAVLSTLLLPLLLSQPPRAIADVHLSIAALADHLSIEACSRFLDLLSRRNMILLCNAILLIVLRDAGVLSCRAAARHNADGDGLESLQLQLVMKA
ncbi:hypothetical protein E2562_020099 [Oryza meyeriana var. granulata]|uniref:Hydrophobic seed protein domain-containing protein n=1 Tax=Oryza meyeriana var. granulata TaxID=110450 RepID=A0A6G1E9L2_9ORYZ|nr:hypothetical protein E2562_020099 [Oryza meyeriana var. granulata]